MNERQLINLIENTLDSKIIENEDIIKYSFYELRVKYSLSEYETSEFLNLIKNKLNYMGYKVYITGQKYILSNQIKEVQSNELLIALK